MLQINNGTPFAAKLVVLPNRRGVDTIYTIVKATFTIGAQVAVADEQVPVRLADDHYGDPAASSIRQPSDVSLEKPGTDVLVAGSAWAPGGRPTWQMDVAISAGPLTKVARVFGDRVWDDGPTGATMTWVTPFERMPLIWERAFGGSDDTDKGPVVDARNPVGVGFRPANGSKPVRGLPLPNVEDPAALMSSWKSAPAPAGFGATGAHWLPRRQYAGTYDERWQQHRAPYLPDDFDPRFCQVAPVGLASAQPFRGGEVIDLRGMDPSGVMRFALPTLAIDVAHHVGRNIETRPAILDTVIVEPDARRFMMVWRAALECDKKALQVTEVETTVRQAA